MKPCRKIRALLAGAENVILESNSVLRFLKPDLYLSVVDARVADFKCVCAAVPGPG